MTLCREWLRVVGNEELVHLPIEKLHEQRNVCAIHFAKKDFNKKGNRLKRNAVPTLNLKVLPLTDAQLAEFPQYMYRHSESKESYPPTTDQKENIQEGGPDCTDILPESVPSTSQQPRHILMELTQNDLLSEAVPSTSQQPRHIPMELSQNG
ncbi:unnamed protein product [Spodoptera exigua]|nr:unnamed protein product [Spodoptera exigua]